MKRRMIEMTAMISVVFISFLIFAPAFKAIRQERTFFEKPQEEVNIPFELSKNAINEGIPVELKKVDALAILDNDGKHVYVYDHKIGDNRYRLFFFGKNFQVIKEQ